MKMRVRGKVSKHFQVLMRRGGGIKQEIHTCLGTYTQGYIPYIVHDYPIFPYFPSKVTNYLKSLKIIPLLLEILRPQILKTTVSGKRKKEILSHSKIRVNSPKGRLFLNQDWVFCLVLFCFSFLVFDLKHSTTCTMPQTFFFFFALCFR
jgi:hypothetical protein